MALTTKAAELLKGLVIDDDENVLQAASELSEVTPHPHPMPASMQDVTTVPAMWANCAYPMYSEKQSLLHFSHSQDFTELQDICAESVLHRDATATVFKGTWTRTPEEEIPVAIKVGVVPPGGGWEGVYVQ